MGQSRAKICQKQMRFNFLSVKTEKMEDLWKSQPQNANKKNNIERKD